MGWNGGCNLPDNERHMRSDAGKKFFCRQSQILNIEDLRPSSSNLFNRNIQQLTVSTVALLLRPGLLKWGTIHDQVLGLPASQRHPRRVEVTVAKAGLLEGEPLCLIRLRGSLWHQPVVMSQKTRKIGIQKKTNWSALKEWRRKIRGLLWQALRYDMLASELNRAKGSGWRGSRGGVL